MTAVSQSPIQAVVLGAGRGVRRISSADSYPRALISDPEGRRVLDWTLSALKEHGIEDVVFVAGYHIEKLVKDYTGLKFLFDKDWAQGGTAQSLFRSGAEISGPTIILPGDMVFQSEALKDMLEGDDDIVAGRVERGTEGAPAGFTGFLKLSAAGAEAIRRLDPQSLGNGAAEKGLSVLADALARQNEVRWLDLNRDIALIRSELDFARFVMGSKARTLERLKPNLRSATILDLVRFSVGQWQAGRQDIIDQVRSRIGAVPLVVRSSSQAEDGFRKSGAGRFESVLDVPGDDEHAIAEAVDRVIASYGDADHPARDGDEVFVQPMINDVMVSGVVLTRDLNTGAPYRVFNFDVSSGRTDTVTSGGQTGMNVARVHRDFPELTPEAVQPLVRPIEELVELVGFDALDIEFAIDADKTPIVFQVRPIADLDRWGALSDTDINDELSDAHDFVSDLLASHPGLHGASTVLADMSDWNPSEIIGSRPRPLAVSLYRSLVTDEIWAESRLAQGYKDVRGTPLMLLVAGKPYIDVRASFNSLLPGNLSGESAEQLIDSCLDRLRREPSLQDKVEFQVIPNCYDFSFSDHAQRIAEDGVSGDAVAELAAGLKKLTADIINETVSPRSEMLAAVERMNRQRAAIMDRPLDSPHQISRAVDMLLHDCARFGTLPFANAARHAFIAASFLKSLVKRDVMDEATLGGLLTRLPTVASDLTVRLGRVLAGQEPMEQFLEAFGHLRPGTYDICIPSYRDAPDTYFGDLTNSDHAFGGADHEGAAGAEFDLGLAPFEKDIAALLEESGLDLDPGRLGQFLKQRIPLREELKFEFSKNLSAALDLIAKWAERMDLSTEEVSYLPVHRVRDTRLERGSRMFKFDLQREVGIRQKRHDVTSTVNLPPVIVHPDDLYAFESHAAEPNFVTAKVVTGPIEVVTRPDAAADLTGRIVAIDHADPGYDWLLAQGIAGLVTRFGGVASHMAIRCAEFDLPAAIGCGDQLFEEITRARYVELNCAAKRLQALH